MKNYLLAGLALVANAAMIYFRGYPGFLPLFGAALVFVGAIFFQYRVIKDQGPDTDEQKIWIVIEMAIPILIIGFAQA